LGAYELDVLTATPRLARYYEAVARAHGDGKVAANWVMGDLLAHAKGVGGDVDALRVRPPQLARLLDLVREGTVSNSAAKQVLTRMVSGGESPDAIVARDGLAQVSDDAQLATWIDEALAAQPEEVRRFAAGERRLLGVLVGAVMKRSGGRADPRRVNQLLAERFGS
jgi:aspartyl-tRNA(Asn)/glutamyl-tRNA(Gln) amidotransferase subunit B